MQPKHGLVERHGHHTFMTRETVEEMITAALNRQAVVRTEKENELLYEVQKKVAVLEHQRDEALEKNAVVEDEHFEALEKIKIFENERDEALEQVTEAERDVEIAGEYVKKELALKQKEFDDMLATKEAKIAHLESQLAKIHSLSKSDEPVTSTSARPEDRSEFVPIEEFSQKGGCWGKVALDQDCGGQADHW
ncbi:hypothetical protein NW768_004821 [Fusarium equiseti]|uniref:Uncharacterized protein n=1 Tax=Fusarium equiseti TaxID=61235 RepID=A0ABQ8RHC7_FUSEQ|nr:hypothetical protein NW768_004821 [Fusarium equiseti]